jgi:phospholipid/cholesterol/gamma-HCH transport system ATP-binding protein
MSTATNPIIQLRGVSKTFGTRQVTNELDLDIQKGEFLTVVGRSGEGKSVLLKQIIGLIKPDKGSIVIDGQDITRKDADLRKTFSQCGYVFQFAALLDSLTVLENVAIAQLEQGASIKDVKQTVEEKLDSVGLDPAIINHYPVELSGGMRKRVGLARTLMLDPQIILYDEPTTGLDPVSTQLIHELMRTTHEKCNATTIAISHDINIFEYCTSVAMLYEGKIIHKEDAKSIWKTESPHMHQFIHGLAEGPLARD